LKITWIVQGSIDTNLGGVRWGSGFTSIEKRVDSAPESAPETFIRGRADQRRRRSHNPRALLSQQENKGWETRHESLQLPRLREKRNLVWVEMERRRRCVKGGCDWKRKFEKGN